MKTDASVRLQVFAGLLRSLLARKYFKNNLLFKVKKKTKIRNGTTKHHFRPGTPHEKATKHMKTPQTRGEPIQAGDHKVLRYTQDGIKNGVSKRSTTLERPVNSCVQRVSYRHELHISNFNGVLINIKLSDQVSLEPGYPLMG